MERVLNKECKRLYVFKGWRRSYVRQVTQPEIKEKSIQATFFFQKI